MNNKLSLLYLILIIVSVFSACRGPKAKEDEKNHVLANSAALSRVTDEKYDIDKMESVIIYKGSMLLASKGSHTGYVYLSKGELMFDNDKLVGGTVEIDMNTIEDIDHGGENSLVRHLKSPDFFDVEKFPVSVFDITMVVPVTRETIHVTGNLSIKGITHAVTFPAKIEVKDGIVHADGKITIDRTRWGVRYKSGKVFSNLANEFISDDIEFDIKIVAKK
jgi:polyisoprenoid-binding protein YceI